MAAVKVDPLRLSGPWSDGYVLERQHTLSSEFLGHDGFGNPQFDTKRSELGELVQFPIRTASPSPRQLPRGAPCSFSLFRAGSLQGGDVAVDARLES
jgi:hypothetical protein